jgi:hypothetical protein
MGMLAPIWPIDMLPPVLEIYAVWHPDDPAGQTAANQLVSHFHGSRFSGLIGGAVEVYVRSRGWRSATDAPRSIPFPGMGPPNGVLQAETVAIVPVLGREFARAVEDGPGPWRAYANEIAAAAVASPEHVCVFPLLVHRGATDGTELGRIFGSFQFLAAVAPGASDEPEAELRCRDLAQSIGQLIGQQPRLQVFISHTKHPSVEEERFCHRPRRRACNLTASLFGLSALRAGNRALGLPSTGLRSGAL